jgi:hypothetical protein
LASRDIHELRSNAWIDGWVTASPVAPIGGCDPPQPASNAAATQLLSAYRLKLEILMAMPPEA